MSRDEINVSLLLLPSGTVQLMLSNGFGNTTATYIVKDMATGRLAMNALLTHAKALFTLAEVETK